MKVLFLTVDLNGAESKTLDQLTPSKTLKKPLDLL